MAYDEDVADRIGALVAQERGLSEKRIFGGLACADTAFARSLPAKR